MERFLPSTGGSSAAGLRPCASPPPFQKPKSALALRKFVPTCTRRGETANTANRCSFFREPFIRLHMKLKSSVERRGGVRCSLPFVMHGSRSLGMPFFGLRSLVRFVVLLRSANIFHALCGFDFKSAVVHASCFFMVLSALPDFFPLYSSCVLSGTGGSCLVRGVGNKCVSLKTAVQYFSCGD